MLDRSWLRIAALVVATVHLAACSLFGPRLQTITISSDPEGAKVLVNSEYVGNAPLRTQVQRHEDVLIEARLPGYETAYRTSHRSLSSLGLVDVIGGAILLVPFIGLLSPAAWQHEPASYGLMLDPKDPVVDQ